MRRIGERVAACGGLWLFLLVAIVTFAGCRQKETPPPTATAPPVPSVAPPQSSVTTSTTQPPPVMVAVPAEKPHALPTPNACNGNGSYAAAIDCFRIAAAFHFTLTENGKLKAKGEMRRQAVGSERVAFTLTGSGATDGAWVGSTAPTGVTWTRNGAHVAAPPPFAGRIFQRVTLYLDPQKSEGQPRLDGVEVIDGVTTNRYAFTNANSGERDRVWVSQRDGSSVRLLTDPTPAMRASWPATELSVAADRR
jgi:hypothetical protein